jgi:Ca2+-binding RTX toxin-like protein
VRVTASTDTSRDAFRSRVSFTNPGRDDLYSNNIQIADLNALNAALAVIRFKKHFGFYKDLEREHFSAYQIDGNHILNEDQA